MSVEKAEDTALSFDDLKLLLGPDRNNCSFIYYDQLVKTSVAQLLSKPAVILFLDIHGSNVEKVGHFIALINSKDSIEHFDSYGLGIEEELAITHDQGSLQKLLNESGKKIVTSTFKFQQERDDVQTCGRWSAARVRMRDMSLADFTKFFKQPTNSMDEKVVMLTYFNLRK